jgi:hypothetical protein
MSRYLTLGNDHFPLHLLQFIVHSHPVSRFYIIVDTSGIVRVTSKYQCWVELDVLNVKSFTLWPCGVRHFIFDHMISEIVGSNLTRAMDICSCFLCVGETPFKEPYQMCKGFIVSYINSELQQSIEPNAIDMMARYKNGFRKTPSAMICPLFGISVYSAMWNRVYWRLMR